MSKCQNVRVKQSTYAFSLKMYVISVTDMYQYLYKTYVVNSKQFMRVLVQILLLSDRSFVTCVHVLAVECRK
jgi:hypothetical protein